MHLRAKRVLSRTIVSWFAKVDELPLLVEHVTMLEVVEGVPIENVVTHTIVDGVSVELVCHILWLWLWDLLYFMLL